MWVHITAEAILTHLFLLHFPFTREQELVLKLHRLGQQLLPNPEWTIHSFPSENDGCRFTYADPHPRCFTLDCKLSQRELDIVIF